MEMSIVSLGISVRRRPCRIRRSGPALRLSVLPWWLLTAALLGPMLATAAGPPEAPSEPVDAVRFFPGDGTLYVSPSAIAERLGLTFRADPGEDGTARMWMGDQPLSSERRRTLPDGTDLVPIRDLASGEASERSVAWDPDEQVAVLHSGADAVQVRAGRRSVIAGVTFARRPRELWVPTTELREALEPGDEPDKRVSPDTEKGASKRTLLIDTQARDLVSLRRLPWPDVQVTTGAESRSARLVRGEREAWVVDGVKRVIVNLAAQRLRAWEGDRLVLDTHVSTGRTGHRTPRGTFHAGPVKSRMLVSHKYNDAPMPWSVQVHGDVVIHGFPSVPDRPASHGCIRMPLTGANPARWFYEWVPIGTPITISDGWTQDDDPDSAGSGESDAS